jgi:hypothetical protein
MSANDVIDISLNLATKKKFRINGDNDKILELDISDFNIITRFNDSYPQLVELDNKIVELGKSSDEETNMEEFSAKFKEIDTEMRKLIDTIFDTNVSKVCVSEGSMYDIVDGELRYEHILTQLIQLYETNINSELEKRRANVQKHTDKYAKARKG